MKVGDKQRDTEIDLAFWIEIGYTLFVGASMSTRKNYYVCLRFKRRPEIHMTLRYLKDLAPSDLAEITKLIDQFMAKERVCRFTPTFCIQAWYGPHHTVRVLEPKSDQLWPGWLMLFLAQLPAGDATYKFHPHVACQNVKLTQEVIAVSLMCKKVEVARWDIK